MVIGINCGHTVSGAGYGAVGLIKESEHTRLVGRALMELLQSAGVTVIDCTIDKAGTQSEYLAAAVELANRQDLDWFISIHFNASAAHTGHGVEVYTYEGRQYQDALDVCENISRLGFVNRGVKEGSGLYVIRKTKAKSMLIEVCFCDNEGDVSAYQSAGVQKIAQAIYEALIPHMDVSSDKTSIAGNCKATVDQMQTYIKAKNPAVAQSVLDMIPLYLSEGAAEGIRGDIAFAQSCLETGNFTFKGSAVALDQNNFCGMGVTGNGMKGNSFDTPQLGIRAQIQHLKAYANNEPLVNPVADPRFKYVVRGCAEFVEWLGIQENPQGKGWAAGAGYGQKILDILKDITGVQGVVSESGPFLIKTNGAEIFPEPPKGEIGIGTFTITEVRENWGKLKSGVGWIDLDCCTRI